jgi:tetratricopeptide (TPR) repeat protein
VLVAQGKLDEALQAYRASLAIRERVAAADANNNQWQRDVSVSNNRIGDVLVAQGRLDEALKVFRHDLAIAERLATADRTNTLWQRDLSVSYIKVCDVLVTQGRLDEALGACRAGLTIRERLAACSFAVLPKVQPPQLKPMTTVAIKPANAPCDRRVSDSPCNIAGMMTRTIS